MMQRSARRLLSTMPQAGYLPKSEVLCRVLGKKSMQYCDNKISENSSHPHQNNNHLLGVVSTFRSAPSTSSISEDAYFTTDLGFDTMMRKDLIGKLESEFTVSFPEGEASSYPSVRSVVDYFSSHPKAK